MACSSQDIEDHPGALSCASPQTHEHFVVYSPVRAEQTAVCVSPQPKEQQTFIFRPFQTQGVRTMALKQYQDQDHPCPSQIHNETPTPTSPPQVAEERGIVTTSWRPRDVVPSSSGVHVATSPAAPPVVQIISQTAPADHQPTTVEIELDVDLLKAWPSQDKQYQP